MVVVIIADDRAMAAIVLIFSVTRIVAVSNVNRGAWGASAPTIVASTGAALCPD
jgi:hypothetical protein